MKKLFLVLIFLAVTSGVFSQSVPTPIKFEKCDTNTVTTANDTVSRYISPTLNNFNTIFSEWFQFQIIATDTIWISTDTNFTNKKMILPSESVTTFVYNKRYFSNLYLRVYGVGSAFIRYWLGGL
jgi:hypothetical protein